MSSNSNRHSGVVPPQPPSTSIPSHNNPVKYSTAHNMQHHHQPPSYTIPNAKIETGVKQSSIEVPIQHLDEMFSALQLVNLQLKKLSSYQDQSYQWNLKHHDNMKQVIGSFNKLNTVIRAKQNINSSGSSTSASTTPLEPTKKNPSSNSTSSKSTKKKDKEEKTDVQQPSNIVIFEKNQVDDELDITYHQRIMDTYNENDPYSPELESLVSNIDHTLFFELQEKSIAIILPILQKWFSEDDLQKISLSLIFLWMIHEKFAHMYDNIKYHDIFKHLDVLFKELESRLVFDKLSKINLLPFTGEEFHILKELLDKHSKDLGTMTSDHASTKSL